MAATQEGQVGKAPQGLGSELAHSQGYCALLNQVAGPAQASTVLCEIEERGLHEVVNAGRRPLGVTDVAGLHPHQPVLQTSLLDISG